MMAVDCVFVGTASWLATLLTLGPEGITGRWARYLSSELWTGGRCRGLPEGVARDRVGDARRCKMLVMFGACATVSRE
jgi:hypothetical protein